MKDNIRTFGWVAAAFGVGYAVYQFVFTLPDVLFQLPVSRYVASAAVGLDFALPLAVWRLLTARATDEVVDTPRLEESKKALQQAWKRTANGQVGWGHYFPPHAPQTVSPLSSSFAIRTGLLLALDVDGIAWQDSVQWIVDQARDGGWRAQSQQHPSPEVTAAVAGAIWALCPDPSVMSSARQLLEKLTDTNQDPPLRQDTYVVATVLQDATRIGLSHDCVQDLTERLLHGSRSKGKSRYWTDHLSGSPDATASTAMTAHAVLALQALAAGGATLSGRAHEAMTSGVRWLNTSADLSAVQTKISRYDEDGNEEVNAPRHFTAALVVVALLQGGVVRSRGLNRAVKKVLDSHHNGVWRWDDELQPVWMTYYGLLAVTAWDRRRTGG